MNREIKFRAWDDKNKEWLLGYELENLGGFSIVGESILMGEWGHVFWSFISDEDKDFEDLKIMQYTGLKDKNGTEIYEGDIVLLKDEILRGDGQYDDEIGEVIWDENETCFIFKSKMTTEYLGHAHPDEVIGNIYENPELL